MRSTLLSRVLLEPPRADLSEQERMERALFAAIRLPNGVWKTTYPGRFADVDAALIQHAPMRRPLEVMDVAVSSGISTLELSLALSAAGIEHKITAGDLNLHAEVVRVGSGVEALVQPDGTPILVVLGDRIVPMSSAGYRILKGLLTRISQRLDWERSSRSPGRRFLGARFRVPLSRRSLVPLLSPRLRQLANIEVVNDDLLQKAAQLHGRFDVVRAANIVNRGYFSSQELGEIVTELFARTRVGGVLLICRTHADGSNHATLFKRTGAGLEVVTRLGEGSEVERLTLEVTLP